MGHSLLLFNMFLIFTVLLSTWPGTTDSKPQESGCKYAA